MNILFFALLLLTIFLALSAGFWFRRLPFVRKLRAIAPIIDQTTVTTSGDISVDQLRRHLRSVSGLSISTLNIKTTTGILILRINNYLGDMIVVTHCLLPLASFVERRMSRSIGIGIIITVLLQLIMIVVYLPARAQAAQANSLPDVLKLLMNAGLEIYGVPAFSAFSAFLTSILHIWFFEEAVARHSAVYQHGFPPAGMIGTAIAPVTPDRGKGTNSTSSSGTK